MNKFIITLSLLVCFTLDAEIVRRAALDIGSGGTKIAIADVDTETRQVVEVHLESSFPVPYQASLDKSPDGTFDQETRDLGLKTFKDIKAIAESYQVENITAVATSAFRKANNAKDFAALVKKETGIEIRIIPQREEGEIAFFSALATGTLAPEEVLVWDIGTGSQQMTVQNEAGDLIVFMGENMGSVEFKSYIIDTIQENDLAEVNSPNPMTEEDNKLADVYARAFGRKAYPLIKEKIKNKAAVIGIGRLFYNSIRPIAAEGNVITRNGLRKFITSSLNKSDAELNNPYAHVDVSNCILALAVMKALHIQEIEPVETTTTKGLLVAPQYWENN